jgi:hypothetical protein
MAKVPATTTSTEVATKTAAQLPAGYEGLDLAADAASHNPEMTSQDVALPYIYILQGLSPQTNPGRAEYVEGAVASMFYNNVSGEIFDGRTTGFLFVPSYYERKLVEWVHRDNGGGWVADWPIDSGVLQKTRPDDKGKPRLQNGNVVVETAYHYGLMLNPDSETWEQCVIAMKSSALKANRKWNNMIITSKIPNTDVQAPRFLFGYNLKTKMESKGENSWWNFDVVKLDDPVSVDVYKQAKEFAELVASGVVTRVAENLGDERVDPETGEIIDADDVAY